jgi:maltoporin
MKTLESNANNGSILNTHVLTDADGKAVAPAPMLDESFLKSLTRNFTFSVYLRSGVGFNGNGGPQDFSFKIPENVGGRWRLGNENDTYMELTWKQAHLLGDSPDVMDVSMTFTPRFSWDNTKTTSDSQRSPSTTISMRQAYVEAKNFIKSAPEITVWGGQRFYDRHDIHIHDYFFDDYSGYGMGVDNIDLGFGKLLVSYLGGIRDDLDNNTNSPQTTVNDPRRGGFYMHTADFRIHDIDLIGGKLELIGDYQFFKGGTYKISGGNPDMVIGDASGFRVGFIYQHPFGGYTPPPPPAPSYSKEGKPIAAPPPPPPGPTIAPSFWQIAAFYGYGPGEIMGVDPNGGQSGNTGNGVSGGTPFAGYNFNINRGNIFVRPDGTRFVDSSVRNGTRIRANAQVVWNVTDFFSIGATAYWEYDDQGFPSAEPITLTNGTLTGGRAIGGSRNTVGAGIRPVFWLTDWFAIQGQAGWEYTDRDRSSSLSTFQPGGPGTIAKVTTNDTFGRSGNMGIFTIAPTIKPRGGFFTRPEFRVFATYAIWSKSLEGAIGNTQYQNNDQGWVFGVQSEWFF